ncbi:dihydrofolate reductase [Halioxenophilus sp. WMMB6]|uniref:dihydrofolate reductase n=1 Tax=Halioxenophilus sp. WMMB6 TaxID=3073815 RepID=UPI00295E8E71|nr:dihydrofolate reductase [Halioxenophilus sp. WMMB6]
MARINVIFARSKNHCIGKEGSLPWHLPKEYAHFKRTTLGHPIIMGRKTYEDHNSVLPGRLNIVITRQADYQALPGIVLVATLEEAIEVAKKESDEIFIIGGVEFFTRGYAIADRVFETVVDVEVAGDAYLPPFDFSQWQTQVLLDSEPDERNALHFIAYEHTRRAG